MNLEPIQASTSELSDLKLYCSDASPTALRFSKLMCHVLWLDGKVGVLEAAAEAIRNYPTPEGPTAPDEAPPSYKGKWPLKGSAEK